MKVTNGSAMVKVGGVGGIIWLVGIIISAFHVGGGIVAGIGVLLLSFVGIAWWQRDKTPISLMTGIFGMIAGIILLIGGAVAIFATGIVLLVGLVHTGIFLILLGLVLVREQNALNTQAQLGMDLAYPAMLTVFIGGCAHLTGLAIPAAPAALFLAILFLMAK